MNTYSRNNNNIMKKRKIYINRDNRELNQNQTSLQSHRYDTICTNCGSKRHTYKQCTDPVTSWGIILVTYGDLDKPIHDKSIDLCESDMVETRSRVLIESNTDRLIVSHAYYSIKFLMISRKNSVGYVEFIRGRYRPEKIDQVIYLFKQMMQNEIDKIKYSLSLDNGFEYLWIDFWGTKADSPYLTNDKRVSKMNYDLLKIKGVDGPELDLKYIVSTVKAEYSIEEWGFPKGRKNRYETEIECALREFKEESGYTDDDIKIINEIKPLVEIFDGTNGITYKHVYYIAELISNKLPRNNVTESQREEIGNIQFLDFTSALLCIRDYHIPRKNILEKLFTYYIDKLVLSNRYSTPNLCIESIKDNIPNMGIYPNIQENTNTTSINILKDHVSIQSDFDHMTEITQQSNVIVVTKKQADVIEANLILKEPTSI